MKSSQGDRRPCVQTQIQSGRRTAKTRNRRLRRLEGFLLDYFKGDKVRIVLFGSRARGDNHRTSDVDIGISFKGPSSAEKLSCLDEAIDRLNLPYKVEVVNLDETSEDFRRQTLKDGILWKDFA
ncbi:MAG: nucleotidyltransferase domain-containing protein [Elusimicrobia bacterium]|nr:nucleotidyltransferase domain-containing protein [Elusimicrobiota bacterium]